VQPGPGRPGYAGKDELGRSINIAHPARYKEPVYQLSVHFPPGMKKKEVNIVRKKTPENLKMMKKLRDKLYKEIDTFYGPNRITTAEVLKLRDKNPTLTASEIAEKLKGKVGPLGDKITEQSVKKATLDAGRKGQYGKTTATGRSLEQLKKEAAKLPSGKKYLAEYNKATNKDEALKTLRKRVNRALGNLAVDPEKRAEMRAAWSKTKAGVKSIEKSLEKQAALRMERYGLFNPGQKPEQRLFHALWRSSQQEGSRWKLIGKKPDKWTTELSKGAKFLDTKNNKIITLDGLKKYMDTTPDVGSYKTALKPFKEKAAIQKYLVNYKGKEYKLGNLLNERLWTGDDWKQFKTGTSEIVINHPERVRNNWWKAEVAYKDANKKLNDIETKFLTKMKRADNDRELQQVIKNQFTKDIKKLGPITSISPHGAFGTKPTHSALVQSMVKPMYKKTGDKALSRTLNTLVKQIGCGNVRLASQRGGDVDCYARGLEKIKSGNIKTPGERANFTKLAQTLGPDGWKFVGIDYDAAVKMKGPVASILRSVAKAAPRTTTALRAIKNFAFNPVEMGLIPVVLAADALYQNYADKRDLQKVLDEIPLSGEYGMPQYQKDLIMEGYRQQARDKGGVGLETYAIDQPNISGALEKIGFGDPNFLAQKAGESIAGKREEERQAYEAERERQRKIFDIDDPMMAKGGRVSYLDGGIVSLLKK
jgi:hypothetical protein